ncbi:Longitudinals lacking protein, isoforms F/I/K/T-like Protein [Tribolium castaneum]|uniref:Longitudinals lacking protein, isoforms F/I/K/T-like Protein n=1 Tax=Tribolium castaneum TaxID=7070 RepID=A0A139WLT3_TRICA|nr:Longitudinals lacking protein, isoforms F/I/K/T-like Protein [Tribolium castaneum]
MRKHGENGHSSMRKFKVLSGQQVRPGYSNESLFACRHCGKRYRWKSTMRRHEQVECGGKEPMFQCPQCPYRAKQKGNLGVHVRKHHPQLMMLNDSIVQKSELKSE